jgi:hypothetical protein
MKQKFVKKFGEKISDDTGDTNSKLKEIEKEISEFLKQINNKKEAKNYFDKL